MRGWGGRYTDLNILSGDTENKRYEEKLQNSSELCREKAIQGWMISRWRSGILSVILQPRRSEGQ